MASKGMWLHAPAHPQVAYGAWTGPL